MTILRDFKSGHSVRRDDRGIIFCTCEQDCWYLNTIKTDLALERATAKARAMRVKDGPKLPSVKVLIKEQWNYINQISFRRKW